MGGANGPAGSRKQSPVTAPDWVSGVAQQVTVRLPPGLSPSSASVCSWFTDSTDSEMADPDPLFFFRGDADEAFSPPVEETWETASVTSLEATDHANYVGGFKCKSEAVVCLPPRPSKQERVVHFAPTTPPTPRQRGGLRLRKRGILANCLAEVMKASIGRWTAGETAGALPDSLPESPAHAWLRSYGSGALRNMSSGEDIEGVREVVVPVVDDDGRKVGETTTTKSKVVSTMWIPFSRQENGMEAFDGTNLRCLLVCPELVAELVKKRMFRSVSSVLLGSMRGRAAIWADEQGISAMDLVRIMPGSITLAMLPMLDEVTAIGALRGASGQWSVDVLGALEKGKLKSRAPLPLGNYLRGPLSWLFARRDDRVLAPGVDTLILPA